MLDSANGFAMLEDVDVRLSVELGRTNMQLRDVLELTEDSIVTLDRMTHEPLDVLVNGKLIARAEIVSEGGRFGMKIVEMANGSRPRQDEAA